MLSRMEQRLHWRGWLVQPENCSEVVEEADAGFAVPLPMNLVRSFHLLDRVERVVVGNARLAAKKRTSKEGITAGFYQNTH